ncbi:hypothetical protein [Streptococcus himalayensis]|uniref:Uncharacterized protein n=1 Tax=Streptococcus himalayensis TaxID=1888195 RepID=A0A917A9D2_9STRE|nr:hypothetical protein [Streptococcus himalayensis]GGE36429.1 hypothetical protein GCM10011510_17250 [Streptococcus himalayensis]
MVSIEDYLAELQERLEGLETTQEREAHVIASIREIDEVNNFALLAEISEFIIAGEGVAEHFSPSLKMSSLHWLIHQIGCAIEQTADDEGEKRMRLYYHMYDCMWYLKWVLPLLPTSLALDNILIQEANQLMHDQYQELDFSLAMYYKTLMLQAIAMGDVAEAKKQYQLWQEHAVEKDVMSDCEACEVAEEVRYLSFIGKHKEALEKAEPILQGTLECAELPQMIYSSVLTSLYALGKIEEVEDLLPVVIQAMEEDSNLLSNVGTVIEMAVKIGEEQLAIDLMFQYEDTIFSLARDLTTMKYLIAISPFDEAYYERAKEWVTYFDERNQNHYYSDYLAAYLKDIEEGF